MMAELLFRLLDPAEREVVRGDLAETGLTGGRAVRQLLGLVARRQAALWLSWPPWVALVAGVGLLAPLLGQCLVASSDTLGCLDCGPHFVWVLICGSCATLLWAWESGFMLATLSRRTLWLLLPLFCAVAVWSQGNRRGGPAGTVVLLLAPLATGVCMGIRRQPPKMALVWIKFALLAAAVAGIAWGAGWDSAAAADRLSGFAVLSWPLAYEMVRAGRPPLNPLAAR